MTERPALAVEGNRIPSTRALMEPSNWVARGLSLLSWSYQNANES